MAKNNSKARKDWRKKNIGVMKKYMEMDPSERLLMAIFGKPVKDPKPGTDEVDR